MLIPTDLLEQVERGNVLLFIGERLTHALTGTDALAGLADELATRTGLTDPLSFPELAQAYEDERGRHALVDLVARHFQALGDTPQPAHRLIAGLTHCGVLATTDLSGCLERAFREAGRPLQAVIRNEDIAFEDEGATQLYKLRGTLDRFDSLVLTEDDHARFFRAQDSISLVLQGYLARKTILFLGYDLDDPHFKQLYEKIAGDLDRFQRRAYAFGAPPPPKVARWCKRWGIDLLAIETTDLLQTLTDQLAARARPSAPAAPLVTPHATPLPEQPYKLLDYYEAADAGIYVGREQESLELSSLIRAHRVTLLYGASGVGKTSLLLAGVLPRLAAQESPFIAIYARALEDPAVGIRRAVTRHLPNVALPSDAPLVAFLAAATQALDGPLVLVLDQFEEFFIRLSPQFRAAFIAELGAICDARDLPVKVVLSLREDWLAAVNELERRIPEVFRNRMRVLPLTLAQARQAITAPVERLGRHYEAALVEQLLTDLAGSAATSILPPQLQVVCSALYRQLPPDATTISLSSYAQIGGARGVLQQYLADELSRLGRDERTLARGILAELVTSQGTKAVRSAAELALALDTPPETLLPVLELLVRARLLRALERDDDVPAYELAHEYLIREIALAADAQTRKQAEELIRQEVANWQRFNTLLASDKLALVNDVRGLLRLSPEAQELLLRSALEVGDEVAYWLERMDVPAQRAQVLADRAASRVAAVRRRTAQVLASQDVPESLDPLLKLALADPDATVREAARASLAQLVVQRPALVVRLGETAQRGGRAERDAALQSLSRLPLRDVPAPLRGPVLRTRAQVTVLRLAHASVATAGRRATVMAAGGLMALVLVLALVARNAYYVDLQPTQREIDYELVIRRGLPIFPAFSSTEVDTGSRFSSLALNERNTVTEQQIWGFWLLHGKRDYEQWGKELAVRLNISDGLPLLWYLSRDEGQKWLREAIASSDVGSRGWSAEAFVDLLLVYPQQPLPPTLFAFLQDTDPGVRARTAKAIGRAAISPEVNPDDLIATLLPLLKDIDPIMRAEAASALGQAASNPQLNSTEIVAALLPLLNDTNEFVRRSAVYALGNAATNPQGNPSAIVTILLPLLNDSNPYVRGIVIFALDQAASNPQVNSTEIVAALLPLLNDEGTYYSPEFGFESVRGSVAKALGQAATNPQVNSTEIVAALLPLLNNTNTRYDAVSVLGQAASNPQVNPSAIVAALLPPPQR